MTAKTRAEVVAAIRALADFVEQRTDLPAPTSVHAQHSVTDDTTHEVVTAAAKALDIEPSVWPGNMSARHPFPAGVGYVVHGFLPNDEAASDGAA